MTDKFEIIGNSKRVSASDWERISANVGVSDTKRQELAQRNAKFQDFKSIFEKHKSPKKDIGMWDIVEGSHDNYMFSNDDNALRYSPSYSHLPHNIHYNPFK